MDQATVESGVKNRTWDEADIDSVTLARLVEEVRNEKLDVARSYDRTHNRHNR